MGVKNGIERERGGETERQADNQRKKLRNRLVCSQRGREGESEKTRVQRNKARRGREMEGERQRERQADRHTDK